MEILMSVYRRRLGGALLARNETLHNGRLSRPPEETLVLAEFLTAEPSARMIVIGQLAAAPRINERTRRMRCVSLAF